MAYAVALSFCRGKNLCAATKEEAREIEDSQGDEGDARDRRVPNLWGSSRSCRI